MAQLPFHRPAPGESPLVIAHRGASAAAPENTMAAFELAIAQRADGVELDVQLSADGVAVVVHDRTLRRTTGLRRRVSSLECSQLAQLDCGSWFDARFGSERVPRLADVLDLLRGRLFVNIEMKANRDAHIVDAVVAAVRATKTESEVLLSSFDHRLVLAARNAAPRLARATLVHPFDVGPASLAARAVGASAIVVSRQLLKADRSADARANRLALIVYTVDRRRDIERAVALGVDGIITNDPAATRNVLLGDRAGIPAD